MEEIPVDIYKWLRISKPDDNILVHTLNIGENKISMPHGI
jgi:hypothetical protein